LLSSIDLNRVDGLCNFESFVDEADSNIEQGQVLQVDKFD